MPTFYKAAFSNGRVVKRSTMGRTYTHAWLVEGPSNHAGTFSDSGFSGSERLARSQVARFKRELTFSEVAPAVEITSKEYRHEVHT